MRIGALGLVGVLGLVSCAAGSSKRTQPVAKAAPQAAAPQVVVPAAAQETDTEKRPRLGDAAVYVDGQSRGVLRRLELPNALKAHVVTLPGGLKATRYYFGEYAAALGIDPLRIRALHLYGGSRVSMVDHAAFQRIGSEIAFSFSQDDRGKPRARWPSKKLHINTAIDMLSAVAFYVDKEPPHLIEGEDSLAMPDGTPVEGKVPYAPNEQGNGTRVYVDGALAGTVKRKKLTDDLLAAPNNDPNESASFSLIAYAKTLGIDSKRAKAVDLIAGDDVVARLDSSRLGKATFRVPPRNRGQAVVEVPAAGPKSSASVARVSAVQFFVKLTPPKRDVVAVDDAPDAVPSPPKGGGGGGGASSDD